MNGKPMIQHPSEAARRPWNLDTEASVAGLAQCRERECRPITSTPEILFLPQKFPQVVPCIQGQENRVWLQRCTVPLPPQIRK